MIDKNILTDISNFLRIVLVWEMDSWASYFITLLPLHWYLRRPASHMAHLWNHSSLS